MDELIAKLKNLTVRLLDTDTGISEDAYNALLDCLPKLAAFEVKNQVEATDGMVYLPKNHRLENWITP